MELIKQNEKMILIEWASKCTSKSINNKILTLIDKDLESYWEKFDNTANIMEYSFCTILELKELLNYFSQDEELKKIIKPVVVATFKERERINEINHQDNENVLKNSIPEYIYVF